MNNNANDGGALNTDTAGSNLINNSCISGNSAVNTSGIRSTAATLNASSNWWGASDGPSGSGSGGGDEVNSNVDYTSFSASCNSGAGASSSQAIASASTEAISGEATMNTLQFLDIQNPVSLPFVPSLEDETVWRARGTWDLGHVNSRTALTWVVDAAPRFQDSSLELIFPLDLGNRSRPKLSFQQRIELGGTDSFTIELLPEASTEWVVIDSQNAVSSDWQLHTIDLSAYRGQTIRLRAHLVTGDELESAVVSTGV